MHRHFANAHFKKLKSQWLDALESGLLFTKLIPACLAINVSAYALQQVLHEGIFNRASAVVLRSAIRVAR